MHIAGLLQKHHRWDAAALSAQELLDLATIEGARALGEEGRLGSIEVGKQADLSLFRLDHPTLVPARPDSIVSHLAYSASEEAVDSVYMARIVPGPEPSTGPRGLVDGPRRGRGGRHPSLGPATGAHAGKLDRSADRSSTQMIEEPFTELGRGEGGSELANPDQSAFRHLLIHTEQLRDQIGRTVEPDHAVMEERVGREVLRGASQDTALDAEHLPATTQ